MAKSSPNNHWKDFALKIAGVLAGFLLSIVGYLIQDKMDQISTNLDRVVVGVNTLNVESASMKEKLQFFQETDKRLEKELDELKRRRR